MTLSLIYSRLVIKTKQLEFLLLNTKSTLTQTKGFFFYILAGVYKNEVLEDH